LGDLRKIRRGGYLRGVELIEIKNKEEMKRLYGNIYVAICIIT
jgi:hypothetical protein